MNAVGRSWSLIGTLDSDFRVPVDPRGLVSVRAGRWSLDWWVRASDEWTFPSAAGGVRQRSMEGAPVIETTLRAGGGDVVQRVGAARLEGDHVVVEVENQTAAPVAVAFAIRPYDVQGGGRAHEIRVDGGRVLVDGELALVAGREPGEVVVGAEGIDAASLVAADAPEAATSSQRVESPSGRANAALVFPVVHGTSIRVAVPLDDLARSAPADIVERLPSPSQISRGWGQHAVAAARLVLPPGRWNDAVDACRQQLLLARTAHDVRVAPFGPPVPPEDDLEAITTLLELGYPSVVRELLLSRGQAQTALGAIDVDGKDATAGTLLAIEQLLVVAPDPELAGALSEVVADGARWLLEHRDVPLAAEALGAAHRLLERLGVDDAARQLSTLVESEHPKPVGPGRRSREVDTSGSVSELIEDREGPVGLDLVASAANLVDLARNHPAAAPQLLDALCDVASATWGWPSFAHPALHTGTGGAGHDLRVTAAVARAIRLLLVDDTGTGLEIARHWPAAWWFQNVEVHGLPTRFGSVSWAVRWHGTRTAVLWEIEGASPEITVRAPGLDPGWTGEGASGEALLDPGTPPEAVAEAGQEFGGGTQGVEGPAASGGPTVSEPDDGDPPTPGSGGTFS